MHWKNPLTTSSIAVAVEVLTAYLFPLSQDFNRSKSLIV